MSDVNDLIKLAIETLVKNQETLVAKFILENPTVKAKDIEICQQNNFRSIVFYVRQKSEAVNEPL